VSEDVEPKITIPVARAYLGYAMYNGELYIAYGYNAVDD
jgi:hypothetical protein